jgi:co-chaperonin GroES (HSP10)
MGVSIEKGELNRFILIGDRVLIKPRKPEVKTKSGLYLPPGVHENERIASGYVVKVGPGYPIPNVTEVDEMLKDVHEEIRYIPLQIKEGDEAIYLQKNGYEIEFNGEQYLIMSNSAILMVIRDEDLFL